MRKENQRLLDNCPHLFDHNVNTYMDDTITYPFDSFHKFLCRDRRREVRDLEYFDTTLRAHYYSVKMEKIKDTSEHSRFIYTTLNLEQTISFE